MEYSLQSPNQTQNVTENPQTPTQNQNPTTHAQFPQIQNLTPQNPNPILQPLQPALPHLGQNLNIKLDRDNYLLWKNQLLNVIIANGLEEFIDGTSPCPSKFLDLQRQVLNPQYSYWQRLNRFIMSWLYSSLTEAMASQIVGYSTAFEIWNALERRFAANNRSRIIELRTELQMLKKDGLTTDEYVSKKQSLVDRLVSIGEPVSHDDHLIYLLQGLGPEYNSLVDSISETLMKSIAYCLVMIFASKDKPLLIKSTSLN